MLFLSPFLNLERRFALFFSSAKEFLSFMDEKRKISEVIIFLCLLCSEASGIFSAEFSC